MRQFLAICLFLVVGFGLKTSPAQTAGASSTLTLTQYIQTLDEALAAVHKLSEESQGAAHLVPTLPAAWHVEVDGRTYEIPTSSIRRDLGAWQAKPTTASLQLILQHLETLRYQAVAYQDTAPGVASQRSSLNNILARGEFRDVRGESWLDRLKQRFYDFLFRLMGKLVSSSSIPMIGDILVYGLIVIAVLAVAYWMYRSLRDGTRLETIMPVNVSVSAKGWPIWMSEARAAGARGEWRDAIHFAYWGGISYLEAQGSWRPDRARTPREYLRLLPANSEHQPALRALTMRLEGVWYGMQAAGADGFEKTLAELERLGCPCN
jgi:hypothetical protein